VSKHKAKEWVETMFPFLPTGTIKGMLILAYGAGLDAGLEESVEIITEIMAANGQTVSTAKGYT
jgi:hypothetical protein